MGGLKFGSIPIPQRICISKTKSLADLKQELAKQGLSQGFEFVPSQIGFAFEDIPKFQHPTEAKRETKEEQAQSLRPLSDWGETFFDGATVIVKCPYAVEEH